MELKKGLKEIPLAVLDGSEPLTAQQFAALQDMRQDTSKTPAQRCLSTINGKLLSGEYEDDFGFVHVRLKGYLREDVQQAIDVMIGQAGYRLVRLSKYTPARVAWIKLLP